MSDAYSLLCIWTECSQCKCPTSDSNTRSKSVAKWYNCLINELVNVKQIILYCRQNGLLCRYDIGQFWHVSLIVFQRSIPHMTTHWHLHLLLFLHQNRSLVTCSLEKNVTLSSNCCNLYTIANIVTKFAAYVAWILLCEIRKFGEKICYSNWDNEFFFKGIVFLLAHPVYTFQQWLSYIVIFSQKVVNSWNHSPVSIVDFSSLG